jgi:uncharacterized protein (TIGR03089 family)
MGTLTTSVRGTVPALFAAAVAAGPTRPLITFYDDATGERVELSGVTMANWVAKTGNLLVDGSGLGAGDTADVWLPPHWQTAAILLGCWSAGLGVANGPPALSESSVVFATAPVITANSVSSSADKYVLGLAPMGAALRNPIPGWFDYITEVRGQGDNFAGPTVQAEDRAWLDADATWTQTQLVDRARARAAELGLLPGGRALIDGDAHSGPLDWLLPALAVGASIVLCVQVDRAALPDRARNENVDVVVSQ